MTEERVLLKVNIARHISQMSAKIKRIYFIENKIH